MLVQGSDSNWDSQTRTEFLVDHRNFTGYQQVVRESHFDVLSGNLTKTIDYSFGQDEISQTVQEFDAQEAGVLPIF
ncbi:hypothetical protein [Thalassoglobus neptunius]|uniref:hypothetical protein n=1 Tax=Thalassoglobus neptunius TaxID=1938619 RepID=UPI0011B6499B|nr:hypothetical protein [Thalassoglobus neptunius]